MNNFEAKIKPALVAKHGDMTNEAIAVFRRKWEVSHLCAHVETVGLRLTIHPSTISDTARPASSARPREMS